MAYVPRKGKSPDTIHKIRDELDTVLAGAASRTMQRVAGLRNEELSEAASPGHVRATALVKQLQSGDVESAVDQLLNLAKYMDIRKAMFDAGAIELLVGMVEFLVKEYISLGHIPPNDLSYRGVVHLLYYLANDSSVSCYHYTDRIAEAGAIPLLFHILRGLVDLNWDSTIEAKEIKADAAGVLEILAKRQEADFDSVEKLASLIREGTSHTMYGYTIDHNDAAYMLYHLARNNPDRQRAFLEAKGLFPGLIKLSRRSYPSGQGAKLLLKLFDHPTLASKIASLEQEMEILKRRLSRHEGVVDVTGDGGDAPPVENKLREEHDRATKKNWSRSRRRRPMPKGHAIAPMPSRPRHRSQQPPRESAPMTRAQTPCISTRRRASSSASFLTPPTRCSIRTRTCPRKRSTTTPRLFTTSWKVTATTASRPSCGTSRPTAP